MKAQFKFAPGEPVRFVQISKRNMDKTVCGRASIRPTASPYCVND